VTPLLLGHRGDSANHPENTLAAFTAAVACGADGVELDVRRSRDGELVVIHDDSLDRTTAGSGRVDAHTWPELEGLGVPRLEDVLAALGQHVVAVELKPPHHGDPRLAADVLALIVRLERRATTWLLAFDHAHLAAARALDGAVTTAALVAERPPDLVAAVIACDASALACRWQHVDAAMCTTLHDARRQVLAWTVDGAADALRLAAMGVDVLVSNRPCALARRLQARQ
jgi:glycerophosphoryl diester phosphodiesterase